MRLCLALLVLLAFASPGHAGSIRTGATMRVKANSIWFQDKALLTQWQTLRHAGDAAALASYQEGLLHGRDAWQFTKPVEVRIRGYRAKIKRVDVKMLSDGRLQGTRWVIDEDAVVR